MTDREVDLMTSYQHDRTYDAPPTRRRERRVDRASWTPTFGPGMVLGALGSLGVILSIFLSWRTGAGHPSDIPIVGSCGTTRPRRRTLPCSLR